MLLSMEILCGGLSRTPTISYFRYFALNRGEPIPKNLNFISLIIMKKLDLVISRSLQMASFIVLPAVTFSGVDSSFNLQSILDSGYESGDSVDITNHEYKACGKTLWKNKKGNSIPVGLQLALSADEKVLYGQTHSNQSKGNFDTTHKYFVFTKKDSDGRFTSDITYTNYQAFDPELSKSGFRDIGGSAEKSALPIIEDSCDDIEAGEAKNLIVNGSFERNEAKPKDWWQTTSLDGWNVSNKAEIWSSGFKRIKDSKGGDYYIELDSNTGLDSISQTVKTEAGSTYTLSFDLHRREANRETVEVSLNGLAVNSPTSGEWVNHQYTAETDDITLAFSELEDENDSYGGLIDNVSLVKICSDDFEPRSIASTDSIDGAEVNDSDPDDINKGRNNFLTYSIEFDSA